MLEVSREEDFNYVCRHALLSVSLDKARIAFVSKTSNIVRDHFFVQVL